MASAIGQALAGIEKTPGTQYQAKGAIQSIGAAKAPLAKGNNGLGDAMRNFVTSGVEAYGAYDKAQQSQADERSNEIIRSMTPEERRAATENGTLLYKDDPYAMTLLRQKTGRNAAYEVDAEIQQKVSAGHFKTSREMQEYRQTRLKDASIAYAQSAGVDPNDTDFKRGFDSDIVPRNAALFDQQAQFESKNLEAQAAIEARNDLLPMVKDPNFIGSPDGAVSVTNYINHNLANGGFPSDKQAVDSLVMVANDAVAVDGGADFLRNIGQHKIKVLGGEQTVENLLGPEVYQNLITKADSQTYTRNAKRTENFILGISNAEADVDPASGWQKLNKLEQENDWVQKGEQMTPQRQQLIAAKAAMIERVKRESAQAQVDLDKRAKGDNRLLMIDAIFKRREAGENISTDLKFMPGDENTGKVTAEDMASYAAKSLNMIDSMDVPQEQKDALKLSKLRADSDKGPFQAAFGTLVTDADREWQAAVIKGDASGFKRITELQRVYAQDPSLIGGMFPAQAALFTKLDLLKEMDLDPNLVVQQEALKKNQSQDERRFSDEQWAAIKNDSANPELSTLPVQFETIGRAIFDAHRGLSGDSSAASRAVTEYLKKNTVSFTEDRGWGKGNSAHGMVAKADLQVDPNDTNSWQSGQKILDETLVELSKESVWGQTGRSVEARNGNIVIQSFNGSRMTISKEQLQTIYKERQASELLAKDQEATAKALKQQQDYETFKNGGVYNRGGAATNR